jgi:amino acid adenylation domain-containing protein
MPPSIAGFQLSPQQKRLWKLQQFEAQQSGLQHSNSNCHPYQACCSVLIQGNLELKRLESVIRCVTARHEILRTTFQILSEMEIPLQATRQDWLPTLHSHDLSQFSSEIQSDRLPELILQVRQMPFQLQHPPIRWDLITLSSDRHQLWLHLPALCGDRASLKSLIWEISHAYTHELQHEKLADQPLQYADFAAWHHELLEGEEAAVGKAFWQQQNLADLLTATLPYCHSLIATQSFQPQVYSVSIPTNRVQQIQQIVDQTYTSRSTVLLTVWQMLLWRLTSERDYVIGVGCDGRTYEELQSTLGLLEKYLPLPCRLAGNTSFCDLLQQTHQAVKTLYSWQETFAWEDGKDSSTLEEVPFLPFCFEFEEHSAPCGGADASFTIDYLYACIDRFSLKLTGIVHKDTLLTEFHYDSCAFQLDEIERLAEQFCTVLDQAIYTPQITLNQLEVLSDRERQQILLEFNHTPADAPADYPHYSSIHHWFEEQVRRTPEQVAVIYEQQSLTYAQLNHRANQLAHSLQALGVGAEAIVALCVERSLDFVIGLLGILKAGGAYLPLDSVLPPERLTFMLQDAKAAIVLTQHHLSQQFSQLSQTVLCLDADWKQIAQQSNQNPLSQIASDNLAYVIYTSGSTGQPKGVAVEHRQLLNYLHGILPKLNLCPGAHLGLISTFAADLGHTVLFPALCTGGCVHVISQERAMNPIAFAEYCTIHPLDYLKIVPSHLNALLTTLESETIVPRQCLVLGGETLNGSLIEKIRSYQPDCRILNHYGPTETTVGVLTYLVPNLPISAQCETIPLGRPIANVQVYVLDARLRPVPIGVPGELYISGENLARGYLHQPELTSQAFISNPFSQQTGSRLYKTGDLVRYQSDGTLEFLGRLDHQIKIRGFRIELEEINAVLRQHSRVQDAIVLSQKNSSSDSSIDLLGEQILVAYVVPVPGQPLSSHELRQTLRAKLPEPMIPSAFIQLPTLPLTANGKIDRDHLLALNVGRLNEETPYEAPQTPVEQTLIVIWQQVLQLETVGIYDNFFDRGGHSLLIIQLYSKLRDAFPTHPLAVSDLFQYPTIAALADYLSQGSCEDSVQSSQQRAKQRRELMQRQQRIRRQLE